MVPSSKIFGPVHSHKCYQKWSTLNVNGLHVTSNKIYMMVGNSICTSMTCVKNAECFSFLKLNFMVVAYVW